MPDITILKQNIAILGVDIGILELHIAMLRWNIAILGFDITILKRNIAMSALNIAICGFDITNLRLTSLSRKLNWLALSQCLLTRASCLLNSD